MKHSDCKVCEKEVICAVCKKLFCELVINYSQEGKRLGSVCEIESHYTHGDEILCQRCLLESWNRRLGGKT